MSSLVLSVEHLAARESMSRLDMSINSTVMSGLFATLVALVAAVDSVPLNMAVVTSCVVGHIATVLTYRDRAISLVLAYHMFL